MFKRLLALVVLGTAFLAGPVNATNWTYDGVITVCDPALCGLIPVFVGDPVTGSVNINVGANGAFTLDTAGDGSGGLLDLIDFGFLVGGVVPVEPVACPLGGICDPVTGLPDGEGVLLSGSGTTDAGGEFATGTMTGNFVGGTFGPLGGQVDVDLITGTMQVTAFGGTVAIATVEGVFTRQPIAGSVGGMLGLFAQCINATTGQAVPITLGGATSWDCSAEGLVTSPGDILFQFAVGPVNCAGCSQTGDIVGLDGFFALCRNLTTGQGSPIPLGGSTSWDCASAGFVSSPFDIVLQISRGTVPLPPAVSYAADVQPIFGAKCAPCHTGLGSGGHDIGTTYADAFLAANHPSCAGLNVGQCTIVRIQNGQMPQGAGCTGDPVLDAGNPACLTQAEQDTVQAWIDDGLAP